MNIDFNRICKLAGLNSSGSKNIINESADYSEGSDQEEDQDAMVESEDEEDQDEMVESEDEEDQDEMVDVDISELMSEIRRAKKIIKENKSRKQQQVSKKRRVQENALKRTIAKEVESILAEMEEHDSSWVYGTKKPKHSKAGYTNQGRTIPGLGFRKY